MLTLLGRPLYFACHYHLMWSQISCNWNDDWLWDCGLDTMAIPWDSSNNTARPPRESRWLIRLWIAARAHADCREYQNYMVLNRPFMLHKECERYHNKVLPKTNISRMSGTTPEVHTPILNEENYLEIELRWYLDYVRCALRCLQSINTAIELVTKSHDPVTQPTSHMHLNFLTAVICHGKHTNMSVSKTISPGSVRHLLKVMISNVLSKDYKKGHKQWASFFSKGE